MQHIIETASLNKFFHDPTDVQVLFDVNMNIQQGEFVSVVGKSGCGKSTLLYVLSTMDTDYSGSLKIDGIEMGGKEEAFLAKIRNEKIGFVFQFHYLLNEFTVLQNVMLPALKLAKLPEAQIRENAMKHLQNLGIDKLAEKEAFRISGGEKQRVAIARALINDPLIIMGDEPTGNLDKKNTEIVFETFQHISQSYNQALLIVTHDPGFASRTHRIIEMEDGRIVK